MVPWIVLLIAIAGGACLPVQAAVNAGLARGLGHPLSAAFVSFTAGALFLLAYLVILRVPAPSLDRAAEIPWWAWIGGGFLGAYFVSASLFAAPRVGATVLVMALVTGQILISLFLDHKGLLGMPEQSISPGRIAGVACLILGLFLVRRF